MRAGGVDPSAMTVQRPEKIRQFSAAAAIMGAHVLFPRGVGVRDSPRPDIHAAACDDPAVSATISIAALRCRAIHGTCKRV